MDWGGITVATENAWERQEFSHRANMNIQSHIKLCGPAAKTQQPTWCRVCRVGLQILFMVVDNHVDSYTWCFSPLNSLGARSLHKLDSLMICFKSGDSRYASDYCSTTLSSNLQWSKDLLEAAYTGNKKQSRWAFLNPPWVYSGGTVPSWAAGSSFSSYVIHSYTTPGYCDLNSQWQNPHLISPTPSHPFVLWGTFT